MFCTVLLAVVFALAAFSKVRNPTAFEGFTRSLPRFGLPQRLARAPVGFAFIGTEAATIVLLFAVPGWGFLLAAAMLLAFSAGLANALARGEQTTCRCFGSTGELISLHHLVRNGILVVVAMVGGLGCLVWPASSPVTPVQLLSAALGALSGLLITRWDDLLYVIRGSRSSHS